MNTVPTIGRVLKKMNTLGHVVFQGEDYDLNIIGLRSQPGTPDKFDDYLCCFYKLQGLWQFHVWRGTTDPGLYYLNHPMNANGTAILQPDQYRSCWQLGMHGSYQTLVQTGMPFKVWRDRDLNGTPDSSGPTYMDATGINLHHAAVYSITQQVGKYSAGCAVIQRLEDWEVLMELCKKQIAHGHGSRFSFTLMNWI